ncbi:MAG: methyltransferase [Octadecabacter sp.]
MKWIDMPPVWLLAAAIAVWFIGQAAPLGLSFGGMWSDFAGGIFIGGGLILMLLAVTEMRKRHTTIIPHRDADALVTSGIFKRSRNPIYLGDALLLLGLILRWDAPLALPLVPIFVWIIERRFIIPEEGRLRTKFRQDFHRYTEKTRRWL